MGVAWRARRLATHPDVRVVGLILAIKVVLLVYGALATQVDGKLLIESPYHLLTIWNRWDGPHYLFLAEHGYQATGEQRWFLAFLPLFPWLVRGLGTIFTYLGAALIVSSASSLVLVVLLRRLTDLDGEGLGEHAVWWLLVFPTSYFLHVGYTESLFLALAVGAFLAARHRQWWLVGFLAFLASLTRLNAVVLIPALGLEAWLEYRERRRWNPQWLWIGGVLLGFGCYLYLNYLVGGDAFRFLEYQRDHWHRRFRWPWVGVAESLGSMSWRDPRDAIMVGLMEPVFVVLGLVATILAWARLRASYAVWMTGNWLMASSQLFVFGVPRFTLMLFPLFILAALELRHRQVASGLLTFSSLLLLALFSAQFALGHWGF